MEPSINNVIVCALTLLALATILDFLGTKVLATAAIPGVTAE